MIKKLPAAVLALLLAGHAAADTAHPAQTGGKDRELITGNTLYVRTGPGAPGEADPAIAPIFFGADGAARARLPSGDPLSGAWALARGGYCIDWENGPQESCSHLARAADSFLLHDAATGDLRGAVFTIATGNAENL